MAIHLLLIDDNPDQIAITKRALKGIEDCAVDASLNASEGLDKLLNQTYDLVLCDYRLPTMSGVDLLKQLKARGQDVPFIIVTSAGNERVAVEAMQEGAYDYIVKDAIYDDVLPGIIERSLTRHREKQERRRLEAERDQAQAALRASFDELRRLLQFKDELIAKVSHEFRTPLTSIKEGVALLLQRALGPTTPEQQDYLTVIGRDVDRLAELVNNILDVSKSEAGQMKLQRRQVDVCQLLEMTMQSFRAIKGNRMISIEGQPRALVFVDPHRMLQVFGNLLSNAVKFTADDQAITFRIQRRGEDLAVAVTDTGRGMSAEDLPKLFQKFSQVGARDPNQPKGTGLGLVVCKEMVELHQGRIEVASQLHQGTTFTVLLPMHSPEVMLTESFRDVQVLAVFEQQQTIGLIAIQAEERSGVMSDQPQEFQSLVDEVRRIVHRNDLIVEMQPTSVAVLAITEPDGVKAMVRRLRDSLKGPQRLRFGSAIYPTDGTDAAALFAHATRALEQDASLSSAKE